MFLMERVFKKVRKTKLKKKRLQSIGKEKQKLIFPEGKSDSGITQILKVRENKRSKPRRKLKLWLASNNTDGGHLTNDISDDSLEKADHAEEKTVCKCKRVTYWCDPDVCFDLFLKSV